MGKAAKYLLSKGGEFGVENVRNRTMAKGSNILSDELHPLLPFFFLPMALAVVPALTVGYFFGGRGLAAMLGLMGVGGVGYWVYALNFTDMCCSTGLEPLVLFVLLLLMFVAACVASFVCVCALWVLGLMPYQRRAGGGLATSFDRWLVAEIFDDSTPLPTPTDPPIRQPSSRPPPESG